MKQFKTILMKRLITLTILLFTGLLASACPVCERQQPSVLKGITHGSGPQSNWDYLIIATTAVIVLITFFFSVKWLLRPGENEHSHIKHFILNNEYDGR